jgi:hypothetical protein
MKRGRGVGGGRRGWLLPLLLTLLLLPLPLLPPPLPLVHPHSPTQLCVHPTCAYAVVLVPATWSCARPPLAPFIHPHLPSCVLVPALSLAPVLSLVLVLAPLFVLVLHPQLLPLPLFLPWPLLLGSRSLVLLLACLFALMLAPLFVLGVAPTVPLITLVRVFVCADPLGPRLAFIPARLFDLRLGSFVLVRALLSFGGALCMLSSSCLCLYQIQS